MDGQDQLIRKKTIVVRSNKDNDHYKRFKKSLLDKPVFDKINKQDISVFEDLSLSDRFNLFLYDEHGAMHLRDNQFIGFDRIFNALDHQKQPNSQHGGRRDNTVTSSYKQKYLQYKQKYLDLKHQSGGHSMIDDSDYKPLPVGDRNHDFIAFIDKLINPSNH